MDSILNAEQVQIAVSPHVERWVEGIMPKPACPKAERLRDEGLVYLPFLGLGVLDLSHQIFGVWEHEFKRGVVALQDDFEEQIYHRSRVGDAARVRFECADDFGAGGYFGRIFLILNEDAFLYFDYLESSGICCKAEQATSLLGQDLRSHFVALSEEAEGVEDEIERDYYHRLIANAARSLPDEIDH